MFFAIISGISIGLGMAISIGPYFLFLVNTSLQEGKISASYLALGVAINDILYLSVAYLSIHFFIRDLSFINTSKSLAGVFIMCYGLYTIFKNTKINYKAKVEISPKDKLKNITKGFVFNGLNPSVFVFWFITSGALVSKSNFTNAQSIVAFVSIVFTTFSCDLIKVRLADKFSPFLKERTIGFANRIVGFALVLVAVYLLFFN
jgi:threonine/homoserine/homoserine lactone efflux protein